MMVPQDYVMHYIRSPKLRMHLAEITDIRHKATIASSQEKEKEKETEKEIFEIIPKKRRLLICDKNIEN